MRRVGVCGLGYVGCVTAACMARDGHQVFGLDVVAARVDLVARGLAPFVEPGLDRLLASAVADGRLRASTVVEEVVQDTEAMILCVGTPTAEDETPDLRFLTDAASQIGAALRGRQGSYTLIVRSTIPPGTIEGVVVPTLERAALRLVGEEHGLQVLAVPEFLREGTAIADADDPPIVVVGAPGQPPAAARQLVEDLFPLPERHRWVDYRTSELLKVVCNAFHATKATFANEVGALCGSLGIDGAQLMALLAEDRKLNASAAYLRPGGPFGGSCLPKDLRALVYLGRREQVPTLLMSATLASNQLQVQTTIRHIEALGVKKVALDGLAFKANTDDMRESPMVAIAEALLDRGCQVRIFDQAVWSSREHNDRAKRRLLDCLVETPRELLHDAELLVMRGRSPDMLELAFALGQRPYVLELGGTPRRLPAPEAGQLTAAMGDPPV